MVQGKVELATWAGDARFLLTFPISCVVMSPKILASRSIHGTIVLRDSLEQIALQGFRLPGDSGMTSQRAFYRIQSCGAQVTMIYQISNPGLLHAKQVL